VKAATEPQKALSLISSVLSLGYLRAQCLTRSGVEFSCDLMQLLRWVFGPVNSARSTAGRAMARSGSRSGRPATRVLTWTPLVTTAV